MVSSEHAAEQVMNAEDTSASQHSVLKFSLTSRTDENLALVLVKCWWV